MTSTPADQRNDDLIAAIHEDRLVDVDTPAIRSVCEAIGSRMASELAHIVDLLAQAGIEPTASPVVAEHLQRHTAELHLANGEQAKSAALALQADGFTVWEPTTGGAGRVHAFCHTVFTLARTTDVTIAVRLRWPGGSRRLPGPLVPNQADFSVTNLPTAMWPAYFVIRPVRLVAERLGLRTPAPAVLGPFLSTPADVIPALLELAHVTSKDTIADLGCGDGRILIEAVKRTGCRAIGIETDPELVRVAEERARDAGVSDRVRIIHGDAASTELGQATTVFVFLPADATVTLVEQLRANLEPGTRVIAHEQHRLPEQIPGVVSTAVVQGQGVTVAHQWIVGR